MAHRYQPLTFSDDDTIDPRVWLACQQEFASEFNGFLDRDNLPVYGITRDMVKPFKLNQCTQDAYLDSEPAYIECGSMVWQGGDTNLLGEVEFYLPDDGVVLASWCGTWEFLLGGSPPWTLGATYPATTDITGDGHVVRFRITIDGRVVDDSGWLSLQRHFASTKIENAIQLAGGHHLAKVEARTVFFEGMGVDDPPHASDGDQVKVLTRALLIEAKKR